MNWLTDPAQVCATLDLDKQDGLAEALLIAIASLKDGDGKLLRVKLGNTVEDDVAFARQIADTLLTAKKLRSTK